LAIGVPKTGGGRSGETVAGFCAGAGGFGGTIDGGRDDKADGFGGGGGATDFTSFATGIDFRGGAGGFVLLRAAAERTTLDRAIRKPLILLRLGVP
jgi:hypothetical protein